MRLEALLYEIASTVVMKLSIWLDDDDHWLITDEVQKEILWDAFL